MYGTLQDKYRNNSYYQYFYLAGCMDEPVFGSLGSGGILPVRLYCRMEIECKDKFKCVRCCRFVCPFMLRKALTGRKSHHPHIIKKKEVHTAPLTSSYSHTWFVKKNVLPAFAIPRILGPAGSTSIRGLQTAIAPTESILVWRAPRAFAAPERGGQSPRAVIGHQSSARKDDKILSDKIRSDKIR